MKSSRPGLVLGLAAVGAAFGVLLGASVFALTPGTGWTIVGWNNLGMHCMDADYGVFSILPPYNTVHAQLVDASGKLVKSPNGLSVTYEAVADPSGSINTTSAGKTGFWLNALALFGAPLAVDQGLAGKSMPGPGNPPQAMGWSPSFTSFLAEGIPITPTDDAGAKNPYPMMKLVARNGAGSVLASTRIVLPVSDEMDCSACHASGSGPAARPPTGWVYDPDPQRDYRLNILKVHDEAEASNPAYAAALATAGFPAQGLLHQVTANGKAVLCAACHASEALAAGGVAGVPPLTRAMHASHATAVDPTNGLALDASANRSACYRCHPGSTTRCLRGAMGNAVASDGTMEMQCQSCHGSMAAVGSPARTGWLMEPSCQQCHTGTATRNNGQIRYTSAFEASGAARVAVDSTFATNPNTPAAGLSLYRFSSGHGGLQCSACHGSTHAEFPSSHRNDNLQSLDLQGHSGTLAECGACHATVPSSPSGGPHGMHPVGQAWVSAHGDQAERNAASCRACHGADSRGTVLSRSFAARTLSTEWGPKATWRGFQIGCYMCHEGPDDESRNPNRAAVASAASASTPAGVPVAIPLRATDADGNPLTLRIVSQPANGTVGLTGTTATYYPFEGTSGPDSFTFAAWDGSIDSNLATVSVAVGATNPPSPTPTATATPTRTPTPPTPTPTATPTRVPSATPTPSPSPAPRIDEISAQSGPFRLRVQGSGFDPAARVYIGTSTVPWPSVTVESDTRLTVSGSGLKDRFPVGVSVAVTVVNPDGRSATKTFRR